MKIKISDKVSTRIEKLVINGTKSLNILVPDGNIFSLIDYTKKYITYSIMFNARHTIIDFIYDHGFMYTDNGVSLYKTLDYNDDHPKAKESTNILKLYIDITTPVNEEDMHICRSHHDLRVKDSAYYFDNNIVKNLITKLDMDLDEELDNLFNNEFEFILRKGIYDLNIEVNESGIDSEFDDKEDV